MLDGFLRSCFNVSQFSVWAPMKDCAFEMMFSMKFKGMVPSDREQGYLKVFKEKFKN